MINGFVPPQIGQVSASARPCQTADLEELGQGVAASGRSSRDLAVHELFEMQASATPNSAAVVLRYQELTYAQLNEQANRLAHHLIRHGIVRGDLVGLCMERSFDLIVGLLGILKAGAAYVPLDPAYPDERLAFMLRDTAAPLIVCHRPTASRLATFADRVGILQTDADADAIAAEPGHEPVAGATAADLAYVMYTSGSTGTPKGVLVEHRGIVRLVRDTNYCRFGPRDVFLHMAPLAFDASTFEIWGPLLNGARLALLPPVPPTPDELEAAIRRHGVTTLWLTAGLFHLVVEQRLDALRTLHQLLAGGDVLSPPHVGRALDAMENGVVINGYGPTESTTFACCYRMEKGYQPGSSIPIGQPISNTTVQILDEQLQPSKPGESGELYIGGDGLARGYLNNPGLTQEKFIRDPQSGDPSARLYRTGDRVRSLPDGNLEFLGRFDNQVKIQGHRIEPDEIEAVLRQHPEVHQAVVLVRTQPRGDKQLVAYVVSATPGEFSAPHLKHHLASRLPAHMVPAHFVRMDQLPLTVNGKVDRAALPAPEQPQTSKATEAATQLERTLISLWSRILNCEVGLDENFFDLGGTSLRLLEVHAELTKTLGRQLSMTELFEHATVRSLAGHLAGVGKPSGALAQTQDRAKRQKDAFARQRLAKRIGA